MVCCGPRWSNCLSHSNCRNYCRVDLRPTTMGWSTTSYEKITLPHPHVRHQRWTQRLHLWNQGCTRGENRFHSWYRPILHRFGDLLLLCYHASWRFVRKLLDEELE